MGFPTAARGHSAGSGIAVAAGPAAAGTAAVVVVAHGNGRT